MTDLTDPAVAESLERIIFAGVALTTVAFSNSQPEVELTFPQWRVLVILGAAPEGLRIAEVARLLGVTLPATSRQLRRLERRGLVAVRPDASDRRASLAEPDLGRSGGPGRDHRISAGQDRGGRRPTRVERVATSGPGPDRDALEAAP